MSERKLVTVRKIYGLEPIEGADAIEVATVDGWKVVVKKGEFNLGEDVLYFEIDSFLPESDARYAFLMKSGVRVFEGQRGHKLRTIKLRGQVSQGLILPMREFEVELWGQDLTGDLAPALGIKKWEAPVPAELAGLVKGHFPSFIRKTDQERAQNLGREIFGVPDSAYEITLKLDGSSFTAYHYNGELGVCSRNLELKLTDENRDNTLVKTFYQCGLHHDLPKLGNLAIQAELMGPGIQGNREQLPGHAIFVFDMFNIDEQRYLTPVERRDMMERLSNKVQHVPIIGFNRTLGDYQLTNMDALLKFAEGPSLKHAVREGLVWKSMDGTFSFKTIANNFLLKEKE